LVRLTLFQNQRLRGALLVGLTQAVIIGGVMFLFPMYLQVVVGEDALGTGVRLLPLSIALLVASIGAVGFAARRAPRGIVRVGLLLMLAGLGLAMWAVDTSLSGLWFGIALAVLGLGLGVLASILGALMQGAVGDRDRSETSSLSNASSKVGNAVGTALLGALLISGLGTAFVDNIHTDGRVPDDIAAAISIELAGGVQFVPSSVVEDALNRTDLAPDVAAGIFDSFETAEIQALRVALLVAMVIALIGLVFTRELSGDRPDMAGEPDEARRWSESA
jgi:Na+/melibiose symporter-like transporter